VSGDTLFDVHARSTDPETSKAAARLLGGKAGTMRRRLLDYYGIVGSVRPSDTRWGATAEEATEDCGYTAADGAWKRVSDLLNAGLLEDTGRTRAGSSGRQQRVLRITEKGRAALS